MSVSVTLAYSLFTAGIHEGCENHGTSGKLGINGDGEYVQEYLQSERGRLEEDGGLHAYVRSSYTRDCTCTAKARPFKCTNDLMIMLCADCMNAYLILTEEGVEGEYTPKENWINLTDTFTCEVFKAGETGWASDEDVEKYDWSVNERAFKSRASSRNSSP